MAEVTGTRRDEGGPYAALRAVLDEAFAQSAHGKGKARHANDRPFEQQPILEIGRMVGPGFALGQVMKKAQEARGMLDRDEVDAASAELLGAIVYAASVVVLAREGVAHSGRRLGGNAAAEQEVDSLTQMPVVVPAMSPSVTEHDFRVGDRVDIKHYPQDGIENYGTVKYVGDPRICIHWDVSGESWHHWATLVRLTAAPDTP